MIWKVVAVVINVATPVCGPGTETKCSATFEKGMVSERSYQTLSQCQEAADAAREAIVDRGFTHNTFCARVR